MYSLLKPYPMNTTSILKSYIYVRLLCYYCTHLRDIKRIVDDHLNTRVYQYIFLVFFFVLSISIISQHAISMSLYPISKGSSISIILQTSKVICVVFSTYRKFFFLKMSDYPISLLSSFILIFLVIILTN